MEEIANKVGRIVVRKLCNGCTVEGECNVNKNADTITGWSESIPGGHQKSWRKERMEQGPSETGPCLSEDKQMPQSSGECNILESILCYNNCCLLFETNNNVPCVEKMG